MMVALVLLIVALVVVLVRDRDFWFPDTQQAHELDENSPAPASRPAQSQTPTANTNVPASNSKVRPASKSVARNAVEPAQSPSAEQPPQPAVTRTVLPPLEVEVVAGNVHKTLRPGSNAVRVELQPGAPNTTVTEPATAGGAGNAAGVTMPAAERVQVAADASEVVSRTVKPEYPLLARQTKVQGSVILQALISREGDIQGLHVVSGPPILAGAAQEAVRQWRFKPHYQGSETVETQAKITVNFTISTN